MNPHMTYSKLSLSLLVLVGASLDITGCAAGPVDAESEPITASEPTPAVASKTPIAAVRVSEDTKVVFWAYDEVPVGEITVEGPDSRSPMLDQALKGAETIVAVYRALVGNEIDLTALERLEKLDQAVAQAEAEAERIPQATSQGASEPEVLEGGVESVATAHQAYCTEPGWDWIGDDQWFRSNFSTGGEQYCKTMASTHIYDRYNKNFIRATGFAQSHCASAIFSATYTSTRCTKDCLLFCCGSTTTTWPLLNLTLAPRTLYTFVWYTSKAHPISTSIKSTISDNWTGLAAYIN